MSYALLDAARVAKASGVSLGVLKTSAETSETHVRKVVMIERIEHWLTPPPIPVSV